MKKILSIILATVVLISSVVCGFSVLASELKTYTVDFEDSTKSLEYITNGTAGRSSNVDIVEESNGNKCLKFEYDTTHFKYYLTSMASFAIPDTTAEPYQVLYPNNNANGNVKISFKYKVDKLVKDVDLYIYRAENAVCTAGAAFTIDGKIAYKVASFSANTTTDGWVEVKDIPFTSANVAPIYIGLIGTIRSASVNSQVYIDDIVVEETDGQVYTVSIDGVQSTVTAKAGAVINTADFAMPLGKKITGFTVGGEIITSYPEDATSVITAEIEDDTTVTQTYDGLEQVPAQDAVIKEYTGGNKVLSYSLGENTSPKTVLVNGNGAPLTVSKDTDYLVSFDMYYPSESETVLEVNAGVSSFAPSNLDFASATLTQKWNDAISLVPNTWQKVDTVINIAEDSQCLVLDAASQTEGEIYIDNVRISPMTATAVDNTETVIDFENTVNLYGNGKYELVTITDGEDETKAVRFKNNKINGASYESSQIFLADPLDDAKFLQIEKGKAYRITLDIFSEQDVNNLYARLGGVSAVVDNTSLSQNFVSGKVNTRCTILGTSFKLTANERKTITFNFAPANNSTEYLTFILMHSSADFDVYVDNIRIKQLNKVEAPTEAPVVIDQTAASVTFMYTDGYQYGYATDNSSYKWQSYKNIIYFSEVNSGTEFTFAHRVAAGEDNYVSDVGPTITYKWKSVGDVNMDEVINDTDLQELRHYLLDTVDKDNYFKGLLNVSKSTDDIDVCDLVALAKLQ